MMDLWWVRLSPDDDEGDEFVLVDAPDLFAAVRALLEAQLITDGVSFSARRLPPLTCWPAKFRKHAQRIWALPRLQALSTAELVVVMEPLLATEHAVVH